MSNKLIDLSALSEYKDYSDLKYQDKLTAGNNVTISSNVISVNPTFLLILDSGNKTVPNNSLYEMGDVTLMPGTYVIDFTCTFASNATGYRQIGFSPDNTDITGYGLAWSDTRGAVNGAATQTEVVGVAEVSATAYPNGQKFYFLALQNSGGNLQGTPRCYAFKF